MVGAVQAASLFVITLGTLTYTIKKNDIRTINVLNPAVCALIGFVLGVCSSFLGIGGGPINLVVLFFFYLRQLFNRSAHLKERFCVLPLFDAD